MAYSPLGQGFLTGRFKSPSDFKDPYRPDRPDFAQERFEKNLKLVHSIERVTEDVRKHQGKDITNAQVVLAWVLRQWEGVVPIPGTGSADRVKENMAAARVTLTDEHDIAIRRAAEAREVAGQYADYMAPLLNKDTPEL